MEVPALAVHMPMLQFHLGRWAHVRHGTVKSKRLAGKRVVAIYRHLIVSHVDHGKKHEVIVVRALNVILNRAASTMAIWQGHSMTVSYYAFESYSLKATLSYTRMMARPV